MQVIANVDTKDNYDPALTIEDPQANLLAYTVANATAIARFLGPRREGGGDQSYGPEVPITPQTQPVPNCSGAKFRSAVAGTPARIIATLVGPDDPQLGAGIPFTGTLAGSGTVTPAGGGATLPAGVIVPYAAGAAPTGWLLCDGTHYDATAVGSPHLALWQAIGTTYGGTGQADFAVPDLRGRTVVGKGTHADVDVLGDNDGVALANRTPRHATSIFSSTSVTNQTDAAMGSLGSGESVKRLVGAGGLGALPVDLPAYMALNYVISLGA